MSNSPREVNLPPNLIELYELAKLAFIYYEQQEKKWDLPSLVKFRDALDDIVKAAKTSNDRESERNIGVASEHLSLIVAEGLQRATEERLLRIGSKEKSYRWKRLFYHVNPTVSERAIEERKLKIAHDIVEGRMHKARISVDEVKLVFEHFKAAHDSAVSLESDLRNGLEHLKLRYSITFWFLLAVASGFIGALIQKYLV